MGCLSNGIPGRIIGTNAINFITKDEVPRGKKVSYANFVCDYKQLKDEKRRVRITIGGDTLDYCDETASPAANLLETKILINSVISDSKKCVRFMTLYIKDFSYNLNFRLENIFKYIVNTPHHISENYATLTIKSIKMVMFTAKF